MKYTAPVAELVALEAVSVILASVCTEDVCNDDNDLPSFDD